LSDNSEKAEITLAHQGGVSEISFFNPKANSLTGSQLIELCAAIDNASSESSTKLIYLFSRGDGAFSAGASFEEFKAIKTYEQAREFFGGFARLMMAMKNSSKPIVLRVQGKVVGGGLGIVSCADYVIASSDASARLSEIGLSIGPMTIGLAVERKIGVGNFSAMTLDTEWRDSDWAMKVGLYSQVCSDSKSLNDCVKERLGQLSKVSPLALSENRKMLWEGTNHWESTLEERIDSVAKLFIAAHK